MLAFIDGDDFYDCKLGAHVWQDFFYECEFTLPVIPYPQFADEDEWDYKAPECNGKLGLPIVDFEDAIDYTDPEGNIEPIKVSAMISRLGDASFSAPLYIRKSYLTLMKATIGDAIGLNGGSDEIDLLERKIEALNRKMLEMVNESVQNGNDIESYEDEFRTISEETEALKRRIDVIRQTESDDDKVAERLEQIQKTISEREANKDEYDDSIVRQMIECIKVYPDGKLEIIFGGGVLIEEIVSTEES